MENFVTHFGRALGIIAIIVGIGVLIYTFYSLNNTNLTTWIIVIMILSGIISILCGVFMLCLISWLNKLDYELDSVRNKLHNHLWK